MDPADQEKRKSVGFTVHEKPVSKGLLSVSELQRVRAEHRTRQKQQESIIKQRQASVSQALTETNKARMGSGKRRTTEEERAAAEASEIPLSEIYHLLNPRELSVLHPLDGMGGRLPPVPDSHYKKLQDVKGRIHKKEVKSSSPAGLLTPEEIQKSRRSFQKEDAEFKAFAAKRGILPKHQLGTRPEKRQVGGGLPGVKRVEEDRPEDPRRRTLPPALAKHARTPSPTKASEAEKQAILARNALTPSPMTTAGINSLGPKRDVLSPLQRKVSPTRVGSGESDAKAQLREAMKGSFVRPSFLAHLRIEKDDASQQRKDSIEKLVAQRRATSTQPSKPIVKPTFDGRYRVTIEDIVLPESAQARPGSAAFSNTIGGASTTSVPPSPTVKRQLLDKAARNVVDSLSSNTGTVTSTSAMGTATATTDSTDGTGDGMEPYATGSSTYDGNNYYGGYSYTSSGGSPLHTTSGADDSYYTYARQESETYPGSARGGRKKLYTTLGALPSTLSAADYPITIDKPNEEWGDVMQAYEQDAAEAAKWNLDHLNVNADAEPESLSATLTLPVALETTHVSNATGSSGDASSTVAGGSDSNTHHVTVDKLALSLEDQISQKQAGTWKEAQKSPMFRGRAVLSETVDRSKIDEEAQHRDWNGEFQSLLDMQSSTPIEAKHRGEAIAKLWNDFRDAVLPVVETVICERNSPVKTIPLQSIGGIAGGDKYVFGNIVIKFCATNSTMGEKLYGSYANAIKSASNERKGMNALIQSNIPHLYMPLGMVVTYLGHRVWVASKIPVGEKTLKYGSRDAGSTIEASDQPSHRLMAQAASQLNLAPHFVGKRGKDLVELCGPVDLEIHCGDDGRYYALDTARLFPPDPNPRTGKPRHFYLYKVLRPEHVRNNPVALSSDAHSPFGHHNFAMLDEHVEIAARAITDIVIPRFVSVLNKVFQRASVRTLFDVKSALHDRGINLRYCGLILEHYLRWVKANQTHAQQPLVTHFATEIVARSFKLLVLEELFHLNIATSTPRESALSIETRFQSYAAADVRGHSSLRNYHLEVIKMFNKLFRGDEEECKTFWHTRLMPKLRQKFPCSEDMISTLMECYNRDTITLPSISMNFFHPLLLQKCSKLLGLTWRVSPERDAVFYKRLGNFASYKGNKDLFSMPLLAKMEPVVKLCEVSNYSAVLQCVKEGNLEEAERIYLDELSTRSLAVEDNLLLVPLYKNIVSLYLLPAWGKGRPKLQEAINFSRRIVMIFQDVRDQLGLEDLFTATAMTSPTEPSSKTHEMGPEVGSGASTMESPKSPLSDYERRSSVVFWTDDRLSCLEGYIDALVNLGTLLVEANIDESLAVLSTAYRVGSECTLLDKMYLLPVRMQLGNAWKEKGNWEDSYKEFQAAVAIATNSYHSPAAPKNAPEAVVNALCAFGETANKLGFKKEALDATRRALETANHHFDKESVAHAHAVVTDALVSVEGVNFCGDASAALKAAQVAHDALVEALGPQTPQVSRAKLVMAQLNRLLGDFREGVRLCEEALSAAQGFYGAHSHFEAVVLLLRSEFMYIGLLEEPLPPTTLPKDIPHRYTIAVNFVNRALDIFTKLGKEDTPYYAKALAMMADIYRLSRLESSQQALKLANRSIHILEALNMLSSREYVHAINVASILKLDAANVTPKKSTTEGGSNSPRTSPRHGTPQHTSTPTNNASNVASSVLPDLYKALAASDRHMSIADADFYTIGSILLAQQAKGGRKTKMTLSRDAQIRKMEGLVQLASMYMFFDEQLDTALVIKDIMTKFRQLFPVTQEWDPEVKEFLPKLTTLAEWLLRGTGGVASPVTDLGNMLLKLVGVENRKFKKYDQQKKAELETEEAQRVQQKLHTEQMRLLSQLKQVGMYFALRNIDNGLNLLHAALNNFGVMYPRGATASKPHSITTHNMLIKHLHFAQKMIRPSSHQHGELASATRLNATKPTFASTVAKVTHLALLEDIEEQAQQVLVKVETLPTDFSEFSTPTADSAAPVFRPVLFESVQASPSDQHLAFTPTKH